MYTRPWKTSEDLIVENEAIKRRENRRHIHYGAMRALVARLPGRSRAAVKARLWRHTKKLDFLAANGPLEI